MGFRLWLRRRLWIIRLRLAWWRRRTRMALAGHLRFFGKGLRVFLKGLEIILLMVVGALMALYFKERGWIYFVDIASVRIESPERSLREAYLILYDEEGREIRRFYCPFARYAILIDLDNDKKKEVLVSTFGEPENPAGRLICYHRFGKELWRWPEAREAGGIETKEIDVNRFQTHYFAMRPRWTEKDVNTGEKVLYLELYDPDWRWRSGVAKVRIGKVGITGKPEVYRHYGTISLCFSLPQKGSAPFLIISGVSNSYNYWHYWPIYMPVVICLKAESMEGQGPPAYYGYKYQDKVKPAQEKWYLIIPPIPGLPSFMKGPAVQERKYKGKQALEISCENRYWIVSVEGRVLDAILGDEALSALGPRATEYVRTQFFGGLENQLYRVPNSEDPQVEQYYMVEFWKLYRKECERMDRYLRGYQKEVEVFPFWSEWIEQMEWLKAGP